MTGGVEHLHPLPSLCREEPPGAPSRSPVSPVLLQPLPRGLSRLEVHQPPGGVPHQVEGSEQSRTDLSPTSQAGGGHPAPLELGPWQRVEGQRGGPLAPAQPRLSGWQALFCHIEGRAARGVQVTLLLSQEGIGVDLVLLFCSVQALRSWPLCKLRAKEGQKGNAHSGSAYCIPGPGSTGAGLLGEEAQGEPRAAGRRRSAEDAPWASVSPP